MDAAAKMSWSTYMEKYGPKFWTPSDDNPASESPDAPSKVVVGAATAGQQSQLQSQPLKKLPRLLPKPSPEVQVQVKSPKWASTEPKLDGISGQRIKTSERVRKWLAKSKPEPDFALSFLGAGEVAKPKAGEKGPSTAFMKELFTKPATSSKRKAAGMSEPKKKQKKKEIVVVDLTFSDDEEANATSIASLAKDQQKGNGSVLVNLGASSIDDAAEGLSTYATRDQAEEEAVMVDLYAANHKDTTKRLSSDPTQNQATVDAFNVGHKIPDDGVARNALSTKQTKILRETHLTIANPKEPNDQVVMEDMPSHLATDSMNNEEEYDEEPWTLSEDEELTRWKFGGHSEEQLDWPSFHESRTWEDLQKRLVWMQTKKPICWAVLKMLEDAEQEKFERELSVEIEERKARGQLPSSSEEESDDEVDEDGDEETPDEESDEED
ncbi:MAG: hypothetical protein M1830_008583 [Pleopsidium flavum]|nr:MAG: hypothetical protein M1830_008583 [Pleopsidium flavum]